MSILSFLFTKGNKQSAIGKQVKLRAEEFVITYGEEYKGLDYSQQSLAVLDRLLSGFSAQWADMPGDNKNELLTNISSYILWVANKQYGGNFYWSEQQLQPVLVLGEPKYRLAIMPQNGILKRIEQGEKHNISLFYRKITEQLQQATNNRNILID